MLGEKRRELSGQANKLRNGLFKLDDTKEKVNEMAVELAATQQQVQRSTAECEEYLVSIVSQRRDADETQKLVTARSLKIAEESKVCRRLEEIARADLASVEPFLEEAMMVRYFDLYFPPSHPSASASNDRYPLQDSLPPWSLLRPLWLHDYIHCDRIESRVICRYR